MDEVVDQIILQEPLISESRRPQVQNLVQSNYFFFPTKKEKENWIELAQNKFSLTLFFFS